jgi:hypothetical protein
LEIWQVNRNLSPLAKSAYAQYGLFLRGVAQPPLGGAAQKRPTGVGLLPLGGFQKINHPISTLAKVILSLSKDDFCGSGTGKPAQNHPELVEG